ncbi:MAG: AAA family ATPase [Myxococcales bacterium]|nr:AAA family ATPase [Myxococcales bacterium]
MSILRELVARLGEQPEEALPHARAWAALDAYDLEARLGTMRMAHAAGHEAEAEQYFSAGRRILAEVSDPRERQLVAAWAELRRSPAPTRRNTASAAERAEPAPVVTPAPTPVDRVGGGAPADGTTPRGARGAALSVSADHETSATSTSLPLVGRHRELSMLTAAVDEAKRQQQARILVMQGEPGIGKSRLVEALREHTQRSGGAVVYASAQEGEAGRPYGPWIDALRRVAHGADRDAGANGALEALLPDAHTDATDAAGVTGSWRGSPTSSVAGLRVSRCCCWRSTTCSGWTPPAPSCCTTCSGSVRTAAWCCCSLRAATSSPTTSRSRA